MTISTGGKRNKQLNKKKVHRVGEYVRVNKIFISRGIILDNNFSNKLENSEAAQWMVQHMKRVKATITRHFIDNGVLGGNVDDCFDMIMDEFNTRKDLQFNENHFGLDTGYQIKEYVLNRIGYMVQLYRNEVNKKPQPLLNSDETEYYLGQDEERLGDTRQVVKDVEGFIESDEEYWDDLFSKLLQDFTRFLKLHEYVEFDVELFIIHMYLDIDELGERVDLDNHFMKVSKVSGLSVELVEMVTRDLQRSVEKNHIEALDILTHLTEIVGGKKFGWVPKRMRDSQN